MMYMNMYLIFRFYLNSKKNVTIEEMVTTPHTAPIIKGSHVELVKDSSAEHENLLGSLLISVSQSLERQVSIPRALSPHR